MRSIETLMAEGQQPPKPKRRKRDARVFDSDGHEVFLTLVCTHCGQAKPLPAFGLRRMADGKIRHCPWCRACRSEGLRAEVEG